MFDPQYHLLKQEMFTPLCIPLKRLRGTLVNPNQADGAICPSDRNKQNAMQFAQPAAQEPGPKAGFLLPWLLARASESWAQTP
ncbi:Tight Junction Protein Zo-3 [Manis pentadactyla]|nr:Tight Junction Protein Zo-3 [Manis pentadactyla]